MLGRGRGREQLSHIWFLVSTSGGGWELTLFWAFPHPRILVHQVPRVPGVSGEYFRDISE